MTLLGSPGIWLPLRFGSGAAMAPAPITSAIAIVLGAALAGCGAPPAPTLVSVPTPAAPASADSPPPSADLPVAQTAEVASPGETSASLDAAVAWFASRCRWSDASGYLVRFEGDCARLATFAEDEALTPAVRRALLASDDPRRRFLASFGRGLHGLSVEERVTAAETETVPAVAVALVRPLSNEVDLPPAIRKRAAALTFAEKLPTAVRVWLFSAAERWLRSEPAEVTQTFRDRALREGSPEVKRRALSTLRCEDVAPSLDSHDDAEAERAILVLLGKTGDRDCAVQLTQRAVVEAKKRGGVRLPGLEAYLAGSALACSVSAGQPGAREIGKVHADLAAFLRQRLPPPKAPPASTTGRALQRITDEARRENLQATVAACLALARGASGQAH
jgi:hypothetical protein